MKYLKILYIFAPIFVFPHFCFSMETDSSSSDEETFEISSRENSPQRLKNLSDVKHKLVNGRTETPYKNLSPKNLEEAFREATFEEILRIDLKSLSSVTAGDSSDTDFSSDSDSSHDNLPSYNDFLEMTANNYQNLVTIPGNSEVISTPKSKKSPKSLKSGVDNRPYKKKQKPNSSVPPLQLERLNNPSSQSCFRLSPRSESKKKSPPRTDGDSPRSPRSLFPNIPGLFKKVESSHERNAGELKKTDTSKKSPRSPKAFLSQFLHSEKGSSGDQSEKRLKSQRKNSGDQTTSLENRIKSFKSRRSSSMGDLPPKKPKNLEPVGSPNLPRADRPIPRKLSIELADESRRSTTAKADHRWPNFFNGHKPLKRKKMPPPEIGTQVESLGDCEGKGKEKENNQYTSKEGNYSSLNETQAEYKKAKFGIP